jgi:hypothetical protein
MSTQNPLHKYFRQPKIYISLPSKGEYYATPVNGDVTNLPIFAMSGMDEILLRTPDALYNGEATVRVIESCCPAIADAKQVPSIDVETLLVAIRIASTSNAMEVTHTCAACGTENQYDIELSSLLEHYTHATFSTKIVVNESITLIIKPLSYQEMTAFNIENFRLRKTLKNIDQLIDEDEKHKLLAQVLNGLTELQFNFYLSCIESVQLPDTQVTDRAFISEWLRDAVGEVFTLIKGKIDANRDNWRLPVQRVVCNTCNTENTINVELDQSNFFV